MTKTTVCGLLTLAVFFWTGCGGDPAQSTSPPPAAESASGNGGTAPGTSEKTQPVVENPPPNEEPSKPDTASTSADGTPVFVNDPIEEGAYEGVFAVRPAKPPAKLSDLDSLKLPPIPLRLHADHHGRLVKMTLGQRGFAPGDWGALRGYVIGILGDERGPTSIQEVAEVSLYCDYNLRYQDLIHAITAVSGYRDDENRIVKLIKNITIAPPSTPPPEARETERRKVLPEFPLDVEQGNRLVLPESELARPPEVPYIEMIVVRITKSGAIVFDGKMTSMDGMVYRLIRQARLLDAAGKSSADATIVIRADRDCPAGRVQQLILAGHQRGYEQFALSVREKGAPPSNAMVRNPNERPQAADKSPPTNTMAPPVEEILSPAQLANLFDEAADPAEGEGDFRLGADDPTERLRFDPGKRANAPRKRGPPPLPPIVIRLRTNSQGQFSSIHVNQRILRAREWGQVRGMIISLLGNERGPDSLRAAVEVRLRCDYNVPYQEVINSITAVSGYIDSDDNVVKLVENISISLLSEQPPPESPADVEQPDRVELAESELARPLEASYKAAIGVQLTKSGAILFRGDTISLDELTLRLTEQCRLMEAAGVAPARATVVIRADKDCRAGRVQQLIKACHEQGFEKFALCAKEKVRF